MAIIGIAGLPTEILQQIAADLITTHRLCLVSFASVNRRCHAVSAPILFHTLVISISSRARLRRDVDALLNRPWVLGHVRRVEIVGGMLSRQMEPNVGEQGEDKQEGRSGQKISDVGLVDFVERVPGRTSPTNTIASSGSGFTADAWCHVYRTNILPIADFHTEFQRPYWDDDSWSPLVELLTALPDLGDLVYNCKNQFPPILFRTIRQVLCQCRLQINPVCLQDAYHDSTTSTTDYHDTSPGRFPEHRRETGHEGSLDHLALRWGGSEFDNTTRKLNIWSGHIDFAALRHLSLRYINSPAMDWISQTQPFSNLKHLELVTTCYILVTDGFFASLPPLVSLHYLGDIYPELLVGVVEAHGDSLVNLNLDCPFHSRAGDGAFGEEEVRLIQERCPRLEHLTIPMQRSKSDATEVAMYRILGRIEHLQTLCLRFDWRYIWDNDAAEAVADTPLRGEDDLFDLQTARFLSWQQDGHDEDNNPRHIQHWHIREALLNAAIDRQLAQQIWVCLTSADGTGSSRSQLKSLALEKTGDGAVFPELEILAETVPDDNDDDDLWPPFPQVFEDVVRNLCRQFYLQRSVVPGDERVFVTETRRLNGSVETLETCDDLRRIFRRIWPEKLGNRGGDWRDDSSSVPLEGIDCRDQSPEFVWVDI